MLAFSNLFKNNIQRTVARILMQLLSYNYEKVGIYFLVYVIYNILGNQTVCL